MTDPTPNDLSLQSEHEPGPRPLSTSAQAVLDAVRFEVNAERHAPWIAAAAIRELADQVVPEQPAIPEGDLTEQTYRWDERSGIRAKIFAIVTELEGQ